jgi:hypothetical protein
MLTPRNFSIFEMVKAKGLKGGPAAEEYERRGRTSGT